MRNEADVTIQKKMTFPARSFLLRLASALAIVFFFRDARPRRRSKVCGGLQLFQLGDDGPGHLLVIRTGELLHDQGDLSRSCPMPPPTLWSRTPLPSGLRFRRSPHCTSPGQLAEDVNGSNIAINSSGIVTAPADITPSALKLRSESSTTTTAQSLTPCSARTQAILRNASGTQCMAGWTVSGRAQIFCTLW